MNDHGDSFNSTGRLCTGKKVLKLELKGESIIHVNYNLDQWSTEKRGRLNQIHVLQESDREWNETKGLAMYKPVEQDTPTVQRSAVVSLAGTPVPNAKMNVKHSLISV